MSLHDAQDKISLIVYDDQDAPRYFHVERKTLKFMFWTIPLLVLLSWALIGALAFLNANKARVHIPIISQTATPESITELESEVQALQKVNENLSKKLVSTITQNENSVYLGPMAVPQGMKNLTSKNSITLSDIHFKKTASETEIDFNLINSSKELSKVLGHIWIFKYDSEGVQIYPPVDLNNMSKGPTYNLGETFSVAKLRPVKAIFKQANTKDAKIFHVVLMSRDGDLILSQNLGPFTGDQ